MHYVSALHAETLQSVACHGLHPGRVRLARFLLQIQDRTQGSPVMNMTHELLANVLGVQRTTVTAAALELQQEGLQIGRAHVCTPVTNAHIVCRLLFEKQNEVLTRHNSQYHQHYYTEYTVNINTHTN